MIYSLLKILLGILALIGAGAFSYTYLEQRDLHQNILQVEERPVTQKAVTPVVPVQKKVVAKVTAPIKTNGSLVPKTAVEEKTVVAPGPLRALTQITNTTVLTVRGIIERTNIERAQNGGLLALVENLTLDRDAQMKVEDMFAKQYFEHVSPLGIGPADLAKAVGYAYVVVGENLALGDFGNDTGVVTAWMNSPGHRANILKPQYQEIGVAVEKGMYQGRETWLAVQSFGTPLSACPGADTNVKTQIENNNLTIASMRAELDAKKAVVENTATNDPSYNTFVNEYNALIPPYNSLVETNRAIVVGYNARVQQFNACIAEASGH